MTAADSQPQRLASGGRIDRRRLLDFTFNGKPLSGYQGDTLAAALLANDLRVVGRSFKYHRPRGVMAAGAEEPNALIQLDPDHPARTVPNLRATQVELYQGLNAASVNAWPGPEFDLRASNGWFAPLMPAGFYYKTFMWPKSFWRRYEAQIRKAAGLGRAPARPDPDHYDKMHAHCDLLVVGAGPAGLAAALAAAKAGARVILADEQPEAGGSLLASAELIDGRPAGEWVTYALRELAACPEATLLTRTTVFGYYDHNFLAALERRTDHLPPTLASGPRQRLWRLRAKRVVLAGGAIERPLVFGNNDRPGVMLASAVSTYLRRYAVKPGNRAVLFTNNDGAYQTALDLHAAGVPTVVVDVRPDPRGSLPGRARDLGIELRAGQAVCDIQGGKRIEGVRVMTAVERRGGGRTPMTGIACDLVAVSGGWNPALHLHAQAGGRPRWDEQLCCFVPGEARQAERSAGAANGSFALGECLRQGLRCGAEAAASAGYVGGHIEPPDVNDINEEPLRALWLVPGPKTGGGLRNGGSKQFVDYQNDTTATDIRLAATEGLRSIEHVKRYTLLGFGTDQGKLGNINGMAILAKTLGQDIAETGTTTFRPAYTPVSFGALAGRAVGELFEPLRVTALDAWHQSNGAVFENVGQWRRPWYYPKPGETMQAAVGRECLAVRRKVGIFDGSTLGKIDIQGPDAVKLLNWVYTNRWDKLPVGRCRYGLMLGEDGMVMDDGVTARLGEQHYLMTTTTGNAAAVLDWLERWLQTEWPELNVFLTSVTDHWATVAVAGPDSRALLAPLTDIDLGRETLPFMGCARGRVAGVEARVMRISFSGELAFEVNVPADAARHVWETIIAEGGERDIEVTPYGTETMHVLRAEKGYIIVGQETDGSVTPVDLGLAGMLSRSKDFLGRRSLNRSYCRGEGRKQLVGLRNLEHDAPPLLEGAQLLPAGMHRPPIRAEGHVTSSYYSAALSRPIALALLVNGRKRHGETLLVTGAGRAVQTAEVVEPLFYDPQGERLHG